MLDGDGAALLVVDREHLVLQQVRLRVPLNKSRVAPDTDLIGYPV